MDNETKVEKPYLDEVGERGAKWLRSPHSGWILAAISFSESVFAPIIIDPFLVALILAKRESWLRYTTIAVVFSVLGGFCGYLLGAVFYDFIGKWIIDLYGLEDAFASMSVKLNESAFVFVLLGAITPIPYKLVAIASGLAHLSLITFFFASVFGRIVRLGLVGGATYQFGPRAVPIVRRNLLKFAYVIGVVLLLYFIISIVK